MAHTPDENKARAEELREMSRKLLMQFADEDEDGWVAEPAALNASTESEARD